MSEETRQPLDARTADALEALDLRDPRDHFREQLKSLKNNDPAAFAVAIDHYNHDLLPQLSRPETDPVAAWISFGRFLAELNGPGELVTIDADGRASPFTGAARGTLVLFMPADTARPAFVLSLPRNPSAAQRATCDLLALGKTNLAEKRAGL